MKKNLISQIIKNWVPPIIAKILKSCFSSKKGSSFTGEYTSWEEALDHCKGYDDADILKNVLASTLKVKLGEAAYERDGIIFNTIEYSWEALAGIMWAASRNNGQLCVLDIGGSLGTTYFQNKKFLDKINKVDWSVIEQKHFVDTGNEEFEDERLHFYHDFKTCMKEQKNDIILLSSVLQYIEKPYILLDNILQYNFEYIVIDKTPFSLDNEDHIKLQVVSPNIYEACYPSWLFSEKSLIEYFTSNSYTLFEKFSDEDSLHANKNDLFEFNGMVWEKNQ